MSANCRSVRERLAEAGAQGLRDDAAALRHLETCEACFARLEVLTELDRGLAALDQPDAPEAVVESLLARVAAEATAGEQAEAGPERRTGFFSMPPLPSAWRVAGLFATAAGVAFVLLLSVSSSLLRARISVPASSPESMPRAQAAPPATTLTPRDEARSPENAGGARQDEAAVGDRDRLATRGSLGESEVREEDRVEALLDVVAEPASRAKVAKDAPQDGRSGNAPALTEEVLESGAGSFAARPTPAPSPRTDPLEGGKVEAVEEKRSASAGARDTGSVASGPEGAEQQVLADEVLVRDADREEELLRFAGDEAPPPVERVEPRFPDAAVTAGLRVQMGVILSVRADGSVARARVTEAVVTGSWDEGNSPLIEAVLSALRSWRYAPLEAEGRPVPFRVELSLEWQLGPAAAPPPPTGEAAGFARERERAEGLRFQPARGYWANTWVPGDPVLRLLQTRLQAAPAVGTLIHAASRPPRRPFDPPQGAALGLYLQSDRAALEGPQRVLLEVGLQATRHAGGRRPALELALVLDLRESLSVEEAGRLRAVVLAFARARRGGDRFRLIVAGRSSRPDVEPEGFRYGSLALGLDSLLAEATAGPGDPDGLPVALARALGACAASPEGAAAGVVVVTARSLQPLPALTRLAHRGAVTSAITTSVIGIGPGVSHQELDRLALAGQGYRRLLEDREDAEALAERQLASTGRAVARALRLDIRLAPGVRLVDVVGSRRLDAAQVERVREAERSLDLRLARELGLEADRGEDEDGLQIVIPAFEAGATHSILLDLVAPGPGPVAEATVRYKDVAFLRNGTARASLRLPRGGGPRGPLERSVISLLLARRLEADLGAAGDALAHGDVSGARLRLEQAAQLRAGLPGVWPAFAGDPDLRDDVEMLERYAAAIDSVAPPERQRLSDSLRYAALLKRLPPPAPLVAGPR